MFGGKISIIDVVVFEERSHQFSKLGKALMKDVRGHLVPVWAHPLRIQMLTKHPTHSYIHVP